MCDVSVQPPLSLQRTLAFPHWPVLSVTLQWIEVLTECSTGREWALNIHSLGSRLGFLVTSFFSRAGLWEPGSPGLWHGAEHAHSTGVRPALGRRAAPGELHLSEVLLKSLAPFPELPLLGGGEERNKLCSRCPATKGKVAEWRSWTARAGNQERRHTPGAWAKRGGNQHSCDREGYSLLRHKPRTGLREGSLLAVRAQPGQGG